MEEFISVQYFIVIVRKRSLVPFVSLVWGSLRLAPNIIFGDHVTKIFVVAAMLLSVYVVVSLGRRLVSWCII